MPNPKHILITAVIALFAVGIATRVPSIGRFVFPAK